LLKLLFKLLRNNDGYTAVECGVLVNLGVIFLEKLLIGF
jgi:Flp pilus assembly pilin Flp